jgi:glycerol-3-phosphate dehydrogenase (NAD(P)+)
MILGALRGCQKASSHFRPYSSSDIVGVEVCGAVKNIIAIAAGVAAGLGFGANTQAALITRGLAEISRLAAALGGQSDTMTGLAGLGDLMLTCSSRQSRNTDFGYRIGSGQSVTEALGTGPLVEGAYSASAVLVRAEAVGVHMPIATAVDAVINRKADLATTVESLLTRPLRPERDH